MTFSDRCANAAPNSNTIKKPLKISFKPAPPAPANAPARSCTASAKPCASITLNKMKYNKGAWHQSPLRCLVVTVSFLVMVCQAGHARQSKPDPTEIGAQFVGTVHTTSFPKLLLVHITNPGYTPFHLADAIAASELIIDGN